MAVSPTGWAEGGELLVQVLLLVVVVHLLSEQPGSGVLGRRVRLR